MNWNEYAKNVLKTESNNWDEIRPRLLDSIEEVGYSLMINVQQAKMADVVKKHIYYGKPLDFSNTQIVKRDKFPDQVVNDQTENKVLESERTIHAIFGINTEQAELTESISDYIYNEKQLDLVNIKEEIGDMLWYLAILCDEYSFDLEEIMDINIAKLKKRYGEKFSEEKALNRDLESERKILESKPVFLTDCPDCAYTQSYNCQDCIRNKK